MFCKCFVLIRHLTTTNENVADVFLISEDVTDVMVTCIQRCLRLPLISNDGLGVVTYVQRQLCTIPDKPRMSKNQVLIALEIPAHFVCKLNLHRLRSSINNSPSFAGLDETYHSAQTPHISHYACLA